MRADCKEEVIVPVDWICRVLYWKVRKYARLSELSVVLPSVLQPWLDLTKCSSLPLFATKLQKTQSKGKFVREDFLVYDHRSEEHTSELQSQSNLVCRLLLE